jgi:hypothetical protein
MPWSENSDERVDGSWLVKTSCYKVFEHAELNLIRHQPDVAKNQLIICRDASLFSALDFRESQRAG